MRAIEMVLTAALSSVSDLTWNEVGANEEVRRPAMGAMLAADDTGLRSDTRPLADTAACWRNHAASEPAKFSRDHPVSVPDFF